MTGPRSERTRLRRGAARAEYDNDLLLQILDAGMVAHVGVTTPEGPIVLPMAYGRSSEHLYLRSQLRTSDSGSSRPRPWRRFEAVH